MLVVSSGAGEPRWRSMVRRGRRPPAGIMTVPRRGSPVCLAVWRSFPVIQSVCRCPCSRRYWLGNWGDLTPVDFNHVWPLMGRPCKCPDVVFVVGVVLWYLLYVSIPSPTYYLSSIFFYPFLSFTCINNID